MKLPGNEEAMTTLSVVWARTGEHSSVGYIPTAAASGLWDASHHLTWSRPCICAVSLI